MKKVLSFKSGMLLAVVLLICSSVFAAGPGSEFDSEQGLIRGQAALEELGDRLPDVAVKNRMSAKQLEELLLRDHDIAVTADDKLLYTCGFMSEEAAGAEPGSPGSTGSIAPYNQTFLLHSQPGANKTIYLDFDGEYIVDPSWNNGDPVDALAYDMDGDPDSFTDAELDNIQRIWARVAEDYIMFDDFNVTTEDPGVEALIKDDEFDNIYGNRVLITETNMGSSAGGIAYYNSFIWAQDTTAWAFTTGVGVGVKNLAEVCSHESGHTLGLYHDGTSGGGRPLEYYGGHDNWAPIMGVSYSRAVTQWDKGEYPNSNNLQDDLAAMQAHGFGYRTDDCGDSIGTATALGSLPVTESYGIIETSTDVDVFSFTLTQETDITINAWSDWPQGNLDLDLQLLESDSTLIEQADDSDIGYETVTSTLVAGTYYIRIEGVGGTGYSDYASLGQYYITVLDYIVPPPPLIPFPVPTDTMLIQPNPGPSGTERNDYTGNLGTFFRVNQDVTITMLAFYDHGGNGLASSHTLRLYESLDAAVTGTVIAEVVVPVGTGTRLSDGFRWVELPTPVTLSPQSESGDDWYVLAATVGFSDGDTWYNHGVTGYTYNSYMRTVNWWAVWEDGYDPDAFPNGWAQFNTTWYAANMSSALIYPTVIIEADATEAIAYTGTIADDFPGISVTFEKVLGHSWLSVAADGTLSGMPANGNVGLNEFVVSVEESGGEKTDVALNINVLNIYNGRLGMADFAGFAVYWLVTDCTATPGCFSADVDGDGEVNVDDLHIFALNWLRGDFGPLIGL